MLDLLLSDLVTVRGLVDVTVGAFVGLAVTTGSEDIVSMITGFMPTLFLSTLICVGGVV